MIDQPCFLLGLPQELLFSAVDHIQSKRDLYNLARTCCALEDVCLRRLYKNVVLSTRDLESTPLLRSHVVKAVSELTIYNGSSSPRRGVTRTVPSGAGAFDQKLLHTLAAVPANSLQAFSSYHDTPVSEQYLELLATRQTQSLEHLRAYEFLASPIQSMVLPNRLSVFECCSVGDGKLVADLIRMNSLTLQRLHLGQERELLQQYTERGVGMMEPSFPTGSRLLDPAFLTNLPALQELELVGLDVSSWLPSRLEDALRLCNLTKLSIQSCFGADQFLGALSNVFEFAQDPSQASQVQPKIQLKQFQLRTEAPTGELKRALLLFLSSFTGLESLSLLFENGSVLERVSTLLAGHGPTLRNLTLEARIQARDNLGLDTSRAFGSGGYNQELWERSMNEICQLCPNLMELGFSFPWDDELVRLRKTPLPTLAQLKTIHIRNFPENRALSQVGDYTIKEYAHKFIDWVFPTLVGGQRPALETLAIGPTLYASRMRKSVTKQKLAEFKQTHFFGIDWAMTRFLRWHSMISPVGEKYMEEVREEKPLAGVFEQVWLK